jgi:hypothetical protein
MVRLQPLTIAPGPVRLRGEAKAWSVSLACRKAKDLGYPHELWTTRFLAQRAQEHATAEGHPCLAKLSQGTVCKILNEQEIKPHKVRYYLERRDPEFKEKMTEVLFVYREVEMLKKTAEVSKAKPSDAVAIISYEKPGIEAIANTAPDLPPQPGAHVTFARDHEYKRHGTVSLLAGIDLLTGQVHALVRDRHRSREFIEFLQVLDAVIGLTPRSRSSSTITPRTSPRKPKPGSANSLPDASISRLRRSMDHGSTSSRASFPS